MLARTRAAKRKAAEADLFEDSSPDTGSKVSRYSGGIKTPESPEDKSLEVPNRNFANLPAELLLMIFKHLDSNAIAASVLPVCKTWHDVGRNPVLWKQLKITALEREFSKSLESNAVGVLQRTKHLRSLTLNVAGEVSSILECVAKSCPLLDSLALSQCHVNSDQAVQAIVSSLKLKHLSLDIARGSALKEFAKLNHLVEFEVDRSLEFSPEIRLFGTYIDPAHNFLRRLSRNSRQLETVKIHSSAMPSEEQVLPLLTNLRNVLKDVCLWAPLCHRQTFRAISKCANLVSIKFNLPGSLLDAEFRAMEKLKNLRRIHFEECGDWSPKAWKRFISNINSDHIEYVCFEECDNVHLVLHEVLSTRNDTILHRAKTLDLSIMKMSDHVLKLILTGNPALEDLCLYDNHYFKGYAFNTTDLTVAPALRKLNVKGCHWLRVAYLETFVKNRPWLTIEGPQHEQVIKS